MFSWTIFIFFWNEKKLKMKWKTETNSLKMEKKLKYNSSGMKKELKTDKKKHSKWNEKNSNLTQAQEGKKTHSTHVALKKNSKL